MTVGEEWASFDYLKPADFVEEQTRVAQEQEAYIANAEDMIAVNRQQEAANAAFYDKAINTAVNFSVTWANKIKEDKKKQAIKDRSDIAELYHSSGYSLEGLAQWRKERDENDQEGTYLSQLSTDLRATGNDNDAALADQLDALNPRQKVALKELAARSYAQDFPGLIEQEQFTFKATRDNGESYHLNEATDAIEAREWFRQLRHKQFQSVEGLNTADRNFLELNYWNATDGTISKGMAAWRRNKSKLDKSAFENNIFSQLDVAFNQDTQFPEGYKDSNDFRGDTLWKQWEAFRDSPYSGGGTDRQKKEAFVKLLATGAKEQKYSFTSEEIVNLLENYTRDGQKVFQDKGWKAALGEDNINITKELQKRELEVANNKITEKDLETKNLIGQAQEAAENNGGYLSREDKERFDSEMIGIVGSLELAPNEYKRIVTREQALDSEIDLDFEARKRDGLEITKEEIALIQDTDIRDKWLKWHTETGGYGLSKQQKNSLDTHISHAVQGYLTDTGSYTGGIKTKAMNAKEAEVQAFARVEFKRQLTANNGDTNAALIATKSSIDQYLANTVDPADPKGRINFGEDGPDENKIAGEPHEYNYLRELDKANELKRRNQLEQETLNEVSLKWYRDTGGDPSIFSEQIIPGTEAQLAILVKMSKTGDVGALPQIYYQMSAATQGKVSAIDIANAQLSLAKVNPILDSRSYQELRGWEEQNQPLISLHPTISRRRRYSALTKNQDFNSPELTPLLTNNTA